MKKVLIVVVAVLMAAMFTACNSNSSKTSEPPASDAQSSSAVVPSEQPSVSPVAKKVAGVVFFEDQFMKMLQSGYKDAAEAAGYEFYPGNTNNDAAKEVELLNTYVTQGYAGVAIAPMSATSSINSLEKAANDGLVVGISNSSVVENNWMTGCFTSDDYQLGQMTGQACAEFVNAKLGGIAKVGILEFRPANAEMSAARTNGFLEALKAAGVQVEVLADEDAWEQDKAITIANDIMTAHSDINILWAANEGGTIGATMAIKNAGLAGKVYVFGTDASEQTAALLKDEANILQALTGQDPYTIGMKTMQSVIDTIEGKDNPNKGKKVIVPGFLLSRTAPENIESFLEELKTRTE